MGECVARKQLESLGEALRKIESYGVIPGVAVGKLRIHTVPWHWDTEAAGVTFPGSIPQQRESGREAGSLRRVRQYGQKSRNDTAKERIRTDGRKEMEGLAIAQ